MAEKNRDKEIREEIKRAKRAAAPRKKKPRRTLLFIPVLLLVLGAVFFAAWRNIDGMDSLRRLFTYNKVDRSEDGKVELFRFDSDRTARYAPLGKRLIAVSPTRLALLGENGEEVYSRTVNLASPAIALGNKTAAVYDVGGTEIYIVDERGLVRDARGESGNGILSATLNGSDYLALTTLKSGCRASVTVYDDGGAPVFAVNSSEHYISDARVLSDNRRLAAVSLGEADGMFASSVLFYSFDSDKAVSTATLGGATVLLMENLGDRLAVFQDDRLTFFNADGSLAGSCRYEYPYLRGYSAGGDGFVAMQLARYRSGSSARISTVDAEGTTLGAMDERREILDVSAAGRYVAVLYADSLAIYTADLTQYASLSNTGYARQVVMRPDGTALLLGASRAWLFIP
ncbi:MAG: hypothetical protein IJU66_05865 [Oscillospiraceae bacterium]|nr:hypothetical protein [Oscillospiraceae bacterium]